MYPRFLSLYEKCFISYSQSLKLFIRYKKKIQRCMSFPHVEKYFILFFPSHFLLLSFQFNLFIFILFTRLFKKLEFSNSKHSSVSGRTFITSLCCRSMFSILNFLWIKIYLSSYILIREVIYLSLQVIDSKVNLYCICFEKKWFHKANMGSNNKIELILEQNFEFWNIFPFKFCNNIKQTSKELYYLYYV